MELNPLRSSGVRRSTLSRFSSSSKDPHDPHKLPTLNKISAGATVFVTCLLLQTTAVGSKQLTQDKRSGLICWTCPNKSSNDECNDWAPNVKCQRNETVCKTIHRLDETTERTLSVSKFCASVDECHIDRLGCHPFPSSISSSKRTSLLQQLECESCCDASYCNEDLPNNDTTAKFMSMAIISAHSGASTVQFCPPTMSSLSWTMTLTTALTIISTVQTTKITFAES